MKTSTTRFPVSAIVLAAVAQLANGPLQAADAATEQANHAEHGDVSVIEAKGVVQAVDADANTITLAHEPIPAINWPAMTMQFKVLGNAEEQVKAGDTVTFALLGNGTDSTITKIEKVE